MNEASSSKPSSGAKSYLSFDGKHKVKISGPYPHSKELILSGKPASFFSFFSRKSQYRKFTGTKLDVNNKEKKCRVALSVIDLSTHLGLSVDQTKLLLKNKHYRNLDNLLEFKENLEQVTTILEETHQAEFTMEETSQKMQEIFPQVIRMNQNLKKIKKGEGKELELKFEGVTHKLIVNRNDKGKVNRYMRTHPDPFGEGTYKSAYLCRDLFLGKSVVYAKGKSESVPTSEGSASTSKKIHQMMVDEFKIARHLKNCGVENCAQAYSVVTSAGSAGIMMPFFNGGGALKYLEEPDKQKEIPEDSFLNRIFPQVVKCVFDMHTKAKMAHRDLKFDNICLVIKKDQDDTPMRVNAKVMDFGLSHKLSDKKLTANARGSPLYTSPEYVRAMISRIEDTNNAQPIEDAKPADAWALGIILHEICHGTIRTSPLIFDMLSILLERFNYIENHVRPNLDLSNPHDELIWHLLDPNPNTRWTLNQAWEHLTTHHLMDDDLNPLFQS